MVYWLPALPDFYLLLIVLGVLSLLGLAWAPIRLGLPLFALDVPSVGGMTGAGTWRSDAASAGASLPRRGPPSGIAALFHPMQPPARLAGRLREANR